MNQTSPTTYNCLTKSFATLAALVALSVASFAEESFPRLRASDNGRWLVTADGVPVFLLCDTAWSLALRVNREDAERFDVGVVRAAHEGKSGQQNREQEGGFHGIQNASE